MKEEKKGNSSHDGPERGILDIGCLFFSTQSPHVLVENKQIVPPVLSPVLGLPGKLKMWVGTGTGY